MDRIDLAEDRKRWRAAAQNVMNFQVSQIAGSFWPANEILATNKDSAW